MENINYSDYFALQIAQQEKASSPMDMEQAKQFMEELKKLPSFRLDYTDNGCTERSSLIQTLLEGRGVEHGSAMLEFDDNLHHWALHLAAYGEIETERGLQKIIFDPTEFETIMPLEDWKAEWVKRGVDPRHIHTVRLAPSPYQTQQLLENLHAYNAEAA